MRRLVIFVLDGAILTSLLFGLAVLWFVIANELGGSYLSTSLLVVWLYVAVLKPSKIRTVGYRLTGCRIVNLRGTRPSILRMTFRSMLWIYGPFNFIFDVFWCGIDDDRQTLRDRFAGTCVINKGATPIGNGEIHLARFNALGYIFVYAHVVHPMLSDASIAETAR